MEQDTKQQLWVYSVRTLQLDKSELSVGWVDPWVGLGWVGSGWVEIFQSVFGGLGWVGSSTANELKI